MDLLAVILLARAGAAHRIFKTVSEAVEDRFGGLLEAKVEVDAFIGHASEWLLPVSFSRFSLGMFFLERDDRAVVIRVNSYVFLSNVSCPLGASSEPDALG